MGRELPFLTLWADLASSTGAAVIPLFCTHRPQGRYRLAFETPYHVPRGAEAAAQTAYLERLETAIRDEPTAAVPHLSWDTYRVETWAGQTTNPPRPHLRSTAATVPHS
jgi:hypothetical protein